MDQLCYLNPHEIHQQEMGKCFIISVTFTADDCVFTKQSFGTRKVKGVLCSLTEMLVSDKGGFLLLLSFYSGVTFWCDFSHMLNFDVVLPGETDFRE